MQEIRNYNLVDISEEYKDMLYQWRNSSQIRKNMYTDHFISREEHDRWFNRVQTDDNSIPKLLVYQEQPIGFVNFTDINQEQRKCFWGFYIGDEDAPKGSGKIMGLLALDLIFGELNVQTVCSKVLSFNTRSYIFHQKLGFAEEGRLIEQIYREGRYVDIILMALYKSAWLRSREFFLKKGEDKPE